MNGSARRTAQRQLQILTGILFGTFALVLSPASFAAIYQCQDASGGVIFTDQSCPDKVAGTTVPVPRANIDYGYDPNAKAKVRARAIKHAHKFRNGWQAHNAQMKVLADKPQRRRLSQHKALQAPIVKPTSKRKQKNPYRVTRGY